jgi:hypothetical protein
MRDSCPHVHKLMEDNKPFVVTGTFVDIPFRVTCVPNGAPAKATGPSPSPACQLPIKWTDFQLYPSLPLHQRSLNQAVRNRCNKMTVSSSSAVKQRAPDSSRSASLTIEVLGTRVVF